MDDDTKPSDQNDAFLQLPSEPQDKPKIRLDKTTDAAVDMARQKVQNALGGEPDIETEATDILELGSDLKESKHQKFIYELTNSGKSLEEIQTSWHEYYAGLPDAEKHKVWHEFYAAHEKAKKFEDSIPKNDEEELVIKDKPPSARHYQPHRKLGRKNRELKPSANKALPLAPEPVPKRPMKSLAIGLSAGVITVVILMFSFFNERFVAPLIQPSRTSSNIQLIDSTANITNASEVIIPKINVEIPVVYGVNTIDDNAVNSALEQGVVHYADTAEPGQQGNVVVVGHSSNNILNKGKYKFAFVLLHKLENGDTFYLQKNGVRYTYQVTGKKIVKPSDVSVLQATSSATASLITCDPPGTSTNRLVVTGVQIDPDPSKNTPANTTTVLATQTKVIPGNSPTLWSRLSHWLSQ